MPRFERSKSDSRKGGPSKDFRKGPNKRGYGAARDGPKKRDFGSPRRDNRSKPFDERPKRFGQNRSEMTKVICATCKKECEVPFKPTTDKPIYCSTCYSKNDKKSPDLDLINEKLDKIMKALKIE